MTALCKILLMYVYNTNILNTHLFMMIYTYWKQANTSVSQLFRKKYRKQFFEFSISRKWVSL